ncbi:MAG: T9SS type A sorting domain-containing protein [Ignavibacteriales bacterium]|nr:T9SS type A sorting domain-containing protein [Ignavibacteriales bacterium]
MMHLPNSMAELKKDSVFYQAQASVPDYRKDYNDTSFFAEAQRHYIDIDIYPNFHNLPHDLDSVIQIFGREYVRQNGTLPWTIAMVMDSLTAQLTRGDISKAESTMSDLGHYVADAHQPLHCTENYDGWSTGNGGIHSRYETYMINTFQSSISIHSETVRYITSPIDFAFEFIYSSNALVDSLLAADTYAKSVSGWNGSGTPPSSYYDALWEKTQDFTKNQIQLATIALASLWYTAWVDAYIVTAVENEMVWLQNQFKLEQNYPNPFNPETEIRFTLHSDNHITLRVYDCTGKTISTLIDEQREAGTHTVRWNAVEFPSGFYFLRLSGIGFHHTKKMIFIK